MKPRKRLVVRDERLRLLFGQLGRPGLERLGLGRLRACRASKPECEAEPADIGRVEPRQREGERESNGCDPLQVRH